MGKKIKEPKTRIGHFFKAKEYDFNEMVKKKIYRKYGKTKEGARRYGMYVAGKKIGTRVSAIALAAIAAATISSEGKENKDDSIYLAEVPLTSFSDLANTKNLEVNENGNLDLLFASVGNNQISGVIIDNNGKMQTIQNIDDDIVKKVEKIEVTDGLDIEEVDISIVTKDGTGMKSTKEGNTSQNLESGTYVISGGAETCKENSEVWKPIVTVKNGKTEIGYVETSTLTVLEEDSKENTILKVNTEKLNLRSGPHISDETYITTMKEGTRLIQINDEETKSESNWVYVIYKNEQGDAIIGYASNGGEEQYLKTVQEAEVSLNSIEEEIKEEEKIKGTVEGKKYIKLKTDPISKAETMVEMEPGTSVYKVEEDTGGFVKVVLESGITGYVKEKNFKPKEEIEAEKEIKEENKEEIKYGTLRNLTIHDEGNLKGYVGIDVTNDEYNPEQLRALLSGEDGIYSEYLDKDYIKPDYVYLRAGSTGFGSDFKVIDKETRIKEVSELMKVCNEMKVPFGLYYYSQGTSKEEMLEELNQIDEIVKEAGDLEYHVLPLNFDAEDVGVHNGQNMYTRIYHYAQENGKSAYTDLAKFWINEAKSRGYETSTYIAWSAFDTLINFNEFYDVLSEDCWFVDPPKYDTHSKYIVNNDLTNMINCRQIHLDVKTKNGRTVDIDFMNKDYFKKHFDKAKENEEKKISENANEEVKNKDEVIIE